MEKLWGFSFQSNQANSPVCATDCHLTKSSKRCYHRDFEMVWQGLQTLAMYHTSPPVSILSSTSAQTHWITRRSTQKQQVGSGSVGKLGKLYQVIPSNLPIFLDAYVFFFPFCLAGAEKAQSFTLRTAKALAMTAVDVVCSPDLLTQVREDFRLAKLRTEIFDT